MFNLFLKAGDILAPLPAGKAPEEEHAAAPSLLAEHFAPVLFVGPGKLRAFTGIFFACFHSSIEMLMYIRHFRTTMCIVLALGLPAWWLRTPASDRGWGRRGGPKLW